MVLRWVVAYLLIIALWAVIIVRRPGPTLWKGSSLVVLNVLFVLASAVSVRPSSPGLLAFALVLVVISIVLRKTWILFRISEPDSIAVLERCFAQTRSSAKRIDGGYVVQLGEQEMCVTITPNPIGASVGLPGLLVRFSGGGNSRKAALVRSLFTKQFYASVPTPRFRA